MPIMALLFFLLQAAGTGVRYVDLAAAPPADLPAGPAHVSLHPCPVIFDSVAPAPPDFCYPFPVDVKITSYKPGAGYTKAALVVRVTNHGKGPVKLPVGTSPKPAGGKASYVDFAVRLQNVTWTMGVTVAYGDTGAPSSVATIQPGESIDYEIPVDLDKLKRMIQLDPGTEVPVVVELGSWIIQGRVDGVLAIASEKDPIPSNAFRIPYPAPK